MNAAVLFWLIVILSTYVTVGVLWLSTVAFLDWLRDVLRHWLDIRPCENDSESQRKV